MTKFQLFISGFIKIGDGIIRIATLGNYSPNLEMGWCFRYSLKALVKLEEKT